jgi:CRISPR/Cas system Type II protein with McrA/HNH and RuvC-like nuclease domain
MLYNLDTINVAEDFMEELWTKSQKANLEFFQENLDKFLADPLYKMKFLVIANQKVSGIFDTFENALADAVATVPQGEYVIQQVISDKETINFLYPAMAFV